LSYVDGIYDKNSNKVRIVERVNNERVFTEYQADYSFYYPDSSGKFTSTYGERLSKVVCLTNEDFQKEKRIHSGVLYESDIKPINKCLEQQYSGKQSPVLHTAFFDIEVDFHKEKGFAPPADPFNKITAISIYLDWMDKLICLVIPPKNITVADAKIICQDFDDTIVYASEREMITDFLDLIEDADVLSGWNSEGFDIPYVVNRIGRILKKSVASKLCLWNKNPKKRTFERYGAEQVTYDLIGRLHMDYMQLYMKYTYHEMHSYALDAIAEYELGDKKVVYKGTLYDLYNNDFKKFVEYSRHDTYLLYKLDQKLKFISLASEIAHANTVLIPVTMGAVAVTEQAIINESHERGFRVPDKKRINEDDQVQAAGAHVAYPIKGLHKWIGSTDINSLYPSAIRSLNMSNETIIGQVRLTATTEHILQSMADTTNDRGRTVAGKTFAASWEGLFGTLEYTAIMDCRDDVTVTIDWEDGGSEDFLAKDVYDAIFSKECNWCISANGTIFTLEKEGIIPGLLARWYSERKELQAKLKDAYANNNKADIEYYDKLQLVKKINLNSLYGGLLNVHCRFFDQRIGQSTTLTGRAITKHMAAHINENLTGKYDSTGETLIYGDTDSVYFSAWGVIKDAVESGEQEWDVDTAVALYDSLAEEVNVSYPSFMMNAFHTTQQKGELIKCGREVVGSSGLFITKKRYAIMVVDNEGQRCDVDGKPGKMKAMGLDLKRSDTPVIIQNFLKDILTDTLIDTDQDTIIENIKEFKTAFRDLPSWEKGSPKRINKLTYYTALEDRSIETTGKSARLPGHVRAGYNYNNLRAINKDNVTMEITDGSKAVVCRVKDNVLGMTSVALPVDETNIPIWFKDLPFDDDTMEEAVINKKLENLLGVLDWDIVNRTNIRSSFGNLFDF